MSSHISDQLCRLLGIKKRDSKSENDQVTPEYIEERQVLHEVERCQKQVKRRPMVLYSIVTVTGQGHRKTILEW